MHRTNGDSYGTDTSSHGVPGIHVYRGDSPGNWDATQGRHQEMNALQEEICDVIEHEGITLRDDTETVDLMTQLRAALDSRHKASRVTNDSGVTGTNVDDALEFLDNKINGLDSDDIANASTVSGSATSDALETLDNDIGSEESARAVADSNLQTQIDTIEGDIVTTSGIMELFGFASNLNINYLAKTITYRGSTNLVEILLYLPEVVGTSVDNTLGIASASIPAALRPTTDNQASILCYDNSGYSSYPSIIQVTTTGNWSMRLQGGAVNDFTTSGSKGIPCQLFRYLKSP